jgi:hypothetical protein
VESGAQFGKFMAWPHLNKQTSKHLSWYKGIVVAKLPFGLEFILFYFIFGQILTTW